MKRSLITKAAALLLCIVMSASFCSCSVIYSTALKVMPENAKDDFIIGAIDVNLSIAKSYRTETYGSVIGTVSGESLEVNTHETVIYKNMGKKSMIHHSSTEIETVIADGTTIEDSFCSGYRDGKMYMMSEAQGKNQKIWSPISAEDYIEHLNNVMVDDTFPDVNNDAATKTIEKNEEGKLVLTFKDFSENSVAEFATQINRSLGMLDGEVSLADMVITYTVTKDLYPEKMTVVMVFHSATDAQELPEYNVTTEYGDFNKVKDPVSLDFDDFTQVDDIRVLNDFTVQYSDYQSRAEGEFKISGSLKTTNNGNSMGGSSYNYTVSFTQADGKCTYNIKTKQDGYEYEIKYANGIEKTVAVIPDAPDQTLSTVKKNPAEAYQLLQMLMSPIDFSEHYVADIEIDPRNSHRVTFTLDLGYVEAYEALADEYLGVLSSVVGTIEVEYKDGKIYKVETTVEATINATKDCEGATIVVKEAYKQTFEGLSEENNEENNEEKE